MVINIKHPMIHWNPEESIFSAELSDIESTRFEIVKLCHRGIPIYVENPTTGRRIRMTRVGVDTDGSGEDVYGWRYRGFCQATGKSFRFLFIND
jgi:hypothetical protein